jgi:hypothetical protein
MLNLDCMNTEELYDLWIESVNHIRLTAKKYGYTVKDMKFIRRYASNKRIAINLRLEGKIERALFYEKICENIYTYLSQSAKW